MQNYLLPLSRPVTHVEIYMMQTLIGRGITVQTANICCDSMTKRPIFLRKFIYLPECRKNRLQ